MTFAPFCTMRASFTLVIKVGASSSFAFSDLATVNEAELFFHLKQIKKVYC